MRLASHLHIKRNHINAGSKTAVDDGGAVVLYPIHRGTQRANDKVQARGIRDDQHSIKPVAGFSLGRLSKTRTTDQHCYCRICIGILDPTYRERIKETTAIWTTDEIGSAVTTKSSNLSIMMLMEYACPDDECRSQSQLGYDEMVDSELQSEVNKARIRKKKKLIRREDEGGDNSSSNPFDIADDDTRDIDGLDDIRDSTDERDGCDGGCGRYISLDFISDPFSQVQNKRVASCMTTKVSR
jgi:hypothetical protein